VVTGTDGGRGAANLNYILYIVGFFTGITVVIGVALAYSNRDTASENVRSHFDWQIKIFWRSVRFFVVLTILYFLIFVIGVFTLSIGFILFLIPFGIWLWWLISTIDRVAKGMKALGLGQPVGRLSGEDSGFAPASGAPVPPPAPVASMPPAGREADSARVGQTRWWNGRAWGMREVEYPTTAWASPGTDLGGAKQAAIRAARCTSAPT
jgi:uncharacterized membrane protein